MHELGPTQLARLAQLSRSALTSAESSSPEGNAVGALLEAMFLLAVVDGDLHESEVRELARACGRLLEGTVDADLEGLFLQWSAAMAEEGWERRMKEVSSCVVGTPLAEPAFRLAVAVALADGRMLLEEADAIDLMAEVLGIRPDIANQIVQEVVRDL